MASASQCHISEADVVGTHNRACMTIIGDLCNGLSSCTVIDKNFGVGANASEVVPGGGKPHVLHKLCVRSDGLKNRS